MSDVAADCAADCAAALLAADTTDVLYAATSDNGPHEAKRRARPKQAQAHMGQGPNGPRPKWATERPSDPELRRTAASTDGICPGRNGCHNKAYNCLHDMNIRRVNMTKALCLHAL